MRTRKLNALRSLANLRRSLEWGRGVLGDDCVGHNTVKASESETSQSCESGFDGIKTRPTCGTLEEPGRHLSNTDCRESAVILISHIGDRGENAIANLNHLMEDLT
jgi:hypothetical protein